MVAIYTARTPEAAMVLTLPSVAASSPVAASSRSPPARCLPNDCVADLRLRRGATNGERADRAMTIARQVGALQSKVALAAATLGMRPGDRVPTLANARVPGKRQGAWGAAAGDGDAAATSTHETFCPDVLVNRT